jgi:hypothetical protein
MLFPLVFIHLALVVHAQQTLSTIQYGAFTETATYSIANQLGFFTAQDLNVVLGLVPNSTFAYASVLDGTFDVVTGTIDNDVNLRFNSKENLTVIGQLDEGPDLVLASIPSITNISQLEGKSLIVDSPVSGYAYLLRKVLGENGLNLGTDFIFQVSTISKPYGPNTFLLQKAKVIDCRSNYSSVCGSHRRRPSKRNLSLRNNSYLPIRSRRRIPPRITTTQHPGSYLRLCLSRLVLCVHHLPGFP